MHSIMDGEHKVRSNRTNKLLCIAFFFLIIMTSCANLTIPSAVHSQSTTNATNMSGVELYQCYRSELLTIVSLLEEHQDVLLAHRLDKWEKVTYFRTNELYSWLEKHNLYNESRKLERVLSTANIYMIGYCVYEDARCPRYFSIYFNPSITHDVIYYFVREEDHKPSDIPLLFSKYAFWEKWKTDSGGELLSTYDPYWYVLKVSNR